MFFICKEGEESVLAMASRRGAWFRALAVYQEDAGGIHRENDENVDPMLGGEVETMVQERHVLVRCQPRRQPRTPLRDITHLFPGSGNVSSSFESSLLTALPTCF